MSSADHEKQEPAPAKRRDEPIPETIVGITIAGWVGITFLIAVFLAFWIWGLVKMAGCGGVNTLYFWITLLLFIFVPFAGPLAGLIMALVAVGALWKPGSTFQGMHCPA